MHLQCTLFQQLIQLQTFNNFKNWHDGLCCSILDTECFFIHNHLKRVRTGALFLWNLWTSFNWIFTIYIFLKIKQLAIFKITKITELTYVQNVLHAGWLDRSDHVLQSNTSCRPICQSTLYNLYEWRILLIIWLTVIL